MPTYVIPRSEWQAFCDMFSRQHEGWLTTLEVLSMDLGGQQEATDLPFQSINADLKGSDPDAIEIRVGTSPQSQVTRIINGVARFSYERSETGEHEGLEVLTTTGERTVLRFRTAQFPEALDRIADEDKTKGAGG
ncbi:MAG TPA: DUF5335 family protein [Bryobacteraceae bacterium]|nr:DUF5335 family protein [Bryobacteraceae bacterium]HOL70139.1 DUF5335 family protein [Bryobacteraceae bacterium]HOQ46240.1 DUF5335 family protein [Bryobacteraceae bacterium]HPQ14925.1 DUF5335 family protein [Bryobacteraceae bacterium]HPU74229.1 DUF5335 family protein [Bryobacteraceae bacterium]